MRLGCFSVGRLGAVAMLSLVFTPVAKSDDSEATALGLLRGVENARIATESFEMQGTVYRVLGGETLQREFSVEYSAGKYRIVSGAGVAIYDGAHLYCYDGRDSAVVMPPHQRCTSCLAFDPRALGISTGLYSDLSLEENIAYHSGKDIAVVRQDSGNAAESVTRVELIDRFSQEEVSQPLQDSVQAS